MSFESFRGNSAANKGIFRYEPVVFIYRETLNIEGGNDNGKFYENVSITIELIEKKSVNAFNKSSDPI